MRNLLLFREVNGLTQSQLGDYLGFKKAFVSAIENNRATLPPDKFAKLLANDKGWDTSMLVVDTPAIHQSGKNNQVGSTNVINESLSDRERQELIQLREKTALLSQQVEWLQGIVSKLTDK